jgi:hypothetical protein
MRFLKKIPSRKNLIDLFNNRSVLYSFIPKTNGFVIMTAISSVASNGSLAIAKNSEPRQWTDVKVKQVWLYSLAGLALVGSAVAIGFAVTGPCIPLLGAAIPLFFTAGGLSVYALSLVDYENPAALEKMRREASRMALMPIVEKHGWDKLFRYEILDPAHFESVYRSWSDTASFARLLEVYHQAHDEAVRQGAAARYAIPQPSDWKSKFEAETASMSCDQIIEKYPLKDLTEFQIISPNQKETLDAAAAERKRYQERYHALEQQFVDETPNQHRSLRLAEERAELTYRSNPFHLMLDQIAFDEARELSHIQQWSRDRTQEIQRLCCNDPCRLQESIRRIQNDEYRGICDIRRNADLKRSFVQQSIDVARKIRNQSVAEAEEQFRISTYPVRVRIDALERDNKAAFDSRIAELDQKFRKSLRG